MTGSLSSSRPSPFANYLQHLQQKNKKKSSTQPIKSSAAVPMQREQALISPSTSSSAAAAAAATTVTPPSSSSSSNHNSLTALPVWKERQMRRQKPSLAYNMEPVKSYATKNKTTTSMTTTREGRRKMGFFNVTHPKTSTVTGTHATPVGSHTTSENSDPLACNDNNGTAGAGDENNHARHYHHHQHGERIMSLQQHDTPTGGGGGAMVVPTHDETTTTNDKYQCSDNDNNNSYDSEVDALCDELMMQRDLEGKSNNDENEYYFDEDNDENDEDENLENLTRMIDECAARWSGSAEVAHRQCINLALVNDPEMRNYHKERIIAQQRAEIEHLKAQLFASSQGGGGDDAFFDPSLLDLAALQDADLFALRRVFGANPTASRPVTSSLPPPPVEQIDSVPIEHIEVAVNDSDLCSVTSGLTNLVDMSMRFADDASLLLEGPDGLPPATSRPDAASVAVAPPTTVPAPSPRQRVHQHPLLLKAQDGSSRRALYTGPLNREGKCEGIGVLKFVETGDMYMGEIVNGEMHGQGTYTFANKKNRKNKKRPHKVLRGHFQNNVYNGWNPDAVFWNDTAK